MPTSPIETKIVSLFASGDLKAMDLLYDHYGDTLYGVIYRMVGDEAEAKDILQDAFVKIWKKSKMYDPSKGKLFTWLMSIVRNQTIDLIRKNKRAGKIHGDVSDVVMERTVAENADLSLNYDIQKVLEQLDEMQRELIEHSYIFGFTHPQIAEKFDMPLGTVKTKIRGAMQQLRTIFQHGH